MSGFKICYKVKYLGTWLGEVSVYEQYLGPLGKLQAKPQLLSSLPLSSAEKVHALHLWAYPVMRHVLSHIQGHSACQHGYKSSARHANMGMRAAPGI